MKPKMCPDTGHTVASVEATQRASSDIPHLMQPGAVIVTTINGEETILVGTEPSGFTAILCPNGWRRLQQWKLTRLRTSGGPLRACGQGRAAGFAAARFLLNASYNHIVRHCNGNPFDIRLSNIISISRGLVKQAQIEAERETLTV